VSATFPGGSFGESRHNGMWAFRCWLCAVPRSDDVPEVLAGNDISSWRRAYRASTHELTVLCLHNTSYRTNTSDNDVAASQTVTTTAVYYFGLRKARVTL